MTQAEFLISEVPDPEAARRFLDHFKEKHPRYGTKLVQNQALLSDVLILVSCSPLFATTLLQDPEHIAWLDRERKDASVRDKQALLESLARFSMTHTLFEPNVVLARFRRRELMRIFLKDVRRLSTVAEVTDEISNLADAILEHALRLSRQEMDNRFGQPQETDERGRVRPAELCIVSLGKLGSKELNYSSDIDLLFVFSAIGNTSGSGNKGTTTNLEYFSKVAQSIVRLVGGQGGEGAAYRVDLRLRPHGRVGPLALSLRDTVRYYDTEAAAWERQVLIRSRTSAGSDPIFQRFFETIKPVVFSKNLAVEDAFRNVGLSKQKIDIHKRSEGGIDIKLGAGGIREIEFIAQVLQLAYGGRDKWLRAPHTLVSLARLADRGYLSSKELTQLFEAYEFLRRLEHILQIENGLQTHTVPNDNTRRAVIAARMNYEVDAFDKKLKVHGGNVNRIFCRVFGDAYESETVTAPALTEGIEEPPNAEKLDERLEIEHNGMIRALAPRFAEIIAAHPDVIDIVPGDTSVFPKRDYHRILLDEVETVRDFGSKLCQLRKCWYRQLIEIVSFDAQGKLALEECKTAQTNLAEASIEVALRIATDQTSVRFPEADEVPIAVLGLGKLGSGSIDYFSDLDLVFVHGKLPQSRPEYLSRLVESFTNVLSSVTRDGSLYRVDLRLRPHGNDGALVVSSNALLDYFRNDAAIWELLAFVKLRAIKGDLQLGQAVEKEIAKIIHLRALQVGDEKLKAETVSIRRRLEKPTTSVGSRNIDFKYGEGGLLDVYFAVRYTQLRLGIRDIGENRSTGSTLAQIVRTLTRSGSSESDLAAWCQISNGYAFLSELDHTVRLTVGRNSRLPLSKPKMLQIMANRFGESDSNELLKTLNIHRMAILEAFEHILGN